MSSWDEKCRLCGTRMEEIDCHEGGNYRDWAIFWCSECGTVCGSFEETSGPRDFHWHFPKMTDKPEIKTALVLMKKS